MLKVGSIVVAEIYGIEQDRVLLKYGDSNICVDVNSVTWSRFCKLTDVVSIGDTVEVKILTFDDARRVYNGSMKALRLELNPYVPLAARPPNMRLRGVVKRVGDGEPPLVEFDSGARGVLKEYGVASPLHPGQVVEVVITRVDPEAEENNLDLRMVDAWNYQAQ
jgi:ribosomal protein S1